MDYKNVRIVDGEGESSKERFRQVLKGIKERMQAEDFAIPVRDGNYISRTGGFHGVPCGGGGSGSGLHDLLAYKAEHLD